MAESRLGRWALAATIVWSISEIVAYSNVGVSFPTWMALFALTMLVVTWSLIGLAHSALTAWRDDADVRVASGPWTRGALCLAATFAALWMMLPLKTRLFFSGPALRQSVDYLAALSPERFQTAPPWIGLFRVRSFAKYDGELRFLVGPCGFVDTCGLVYSPGGRPPNRGEDSFQHLYAEWWHWRQSF